MNEWQWSVWFSWGPLFWAKVWRASIRSAIQQWLTIILQPVLWVWIWMCGPRPCTPSPMTEKISSLPSYISVSAKRRWGKACAITWSIRFSVSVCVCCRCVMETDKVLYNTASGKLPPHPVSLHPRRSVIIWRNLLTFPFISMAVVGWHRTLWK